MNNSGFTFESASEFLMLQCVPVPSRKYSLKQQPRAVLPAEQVTCDYCDMKKETMRMDENGRCRCVDCCLKILRDDEEKCNRCNRKESRDSSLVINSRRLCNICLCAKACKVTGQNIVTNMMVERELSKLRKMIVGELQIGERVTLRYHTIEALYLEYNSFYKDEVNIQCPLGPTGIIVSFTRCCNIPNSALSKGHYTIQLDTGGDLINVPSADGLRYEGQKIELRTWMINVDRS